MSVEPHSPPSEPAGFRAWRDRFGHWPHAAQRLHDTLDLDRIEAHAVRILARGMRSQRLVAFVGAGASMAYGRLTWNGLMSTLYDMVEVRCGAKAKPSEGQEVWGRIRQALWRDKASFMAYDKHALKAQVLSMALRHAAPQPLDEVADLAKLLAWETQFQLHNYEGFIDWVLASLRPPAKGKENDQWAGRKTRRLERNTGETGETGQPGLRGVLEALRRHSLKGAQAGVDVLMAETALAKDLVAVLTSQSTDEDSPVRLLALDWGIRRYITTNYDHEIERGLRALGFVESGKKPEVHANQYHTHNFGRHETGEALRFALEGPRRHAEVLHLHGDVKHEDSLIVTEQQYQRLYLDDHATRDLVTNATLANFAANPVLFAGSGVNEDDVIRPMRQFMSGEGHRRDRMAVALFPADRSGDERARQRMRLLLTYGVHVVHFGWADDESPTPPPAVAGKEPPWPWLYRFYDLHRRAEELQQQCRGARAGLRRANETRLEKRLWSDLKSLPVPTRFDSVLVEGHPTLDPARPLALLQAAAPGPRTGDDAWASRLERFVLVSQITRDWLTSAFLCAKLKSLRQQTLACINDDGRLPLVYGRPPDRPVRGPLCVVARHGVALEHPHLQGRFEELAAHIPPVAGKVFDEGIESLCHTVQTTPDFSSWPGRRVVLVCGARGHGKGGQSDRLVTRKTDGEGVVTWPCLHKLARAMGGYLDADDGWRRTYVLHVNLSFSNELGPIISQLAGMLQRIEREHPGDGPAETSAPRRTPDQLHAIEQGMRRLSASRHSCRLLVVLGNAGVLFDSEGQPKNGQVRRVLRMLMSNRFRHAPLDLLLYVGESQVPAELRLVKPRAEGPLSPTAPHAAGGSRYVGDPRLRRRLDRLNIRVDPVEGSRLVVHALSRTRLSELAAAYFSKLAVRLGLLTPVAGQPDRYRFAGKDSVGDLLSRRLYLATGGSRFAITVLMALLDTEPAEGPVGSSAEVRAEKERDAALALAGEVLTALSGPPSGSAIETMIEFALDRWARRHALQTPLPARAAPQLRPGTADPLQPLMDGLCARPRAADWQLATELLWHLGAFSHPVEAEVLLACPRVLKAAELAHRPQPGVQQPTPDDLLLHMRAVLELLVHWCLVFRVGARPLPEGVRSSLGNGASLRSRDRYAPHRHMQRHAMRLMGGRNVESTQWDQFTITTYASLPDEAPVLRPEVHRTLTDVVRTLTAYPEAAQRPRYPASRLRQADGDDTLAMVLDADRVRAAYYLVRSTYSLGVVAHLSPTSFDDEAACGHLEEYHRLVHWITDAARYWEQDYGIVDANGVAPQQPAAAALAWCGQREPDGDAATGAPQPPPEPYVASGIFYPGELVWLYNECGVIRLAQGRLQDAEEMLTMAEWAARRVEGDDSGSLHMRIRLHNAVVQIERGRSQRARLMLGPLAQRLNGHPVPPLLAHFYLGLIDHLGGNYKDAEVHYDTALAGLRQHRRSRATAFVLINRADLAYALRPDLLDEALALANEAITLAQQGGHEDLRMMAMMGRLRVYIEARQFAPPHQPGLFEQLSAAERYAVRMDIPRLSCEVYELRARLLFSQGEYQLSAKDATASLEIAALYDLKIKKARGLLTLAHIYLRRGELADARRLADMGREIANSCDYYTCVRGFKDLELALAGALFADAGPDRRQARA